MNVEMIWASNKLKSKDKMGVCFSWDNPDDKGSYYFGNITFLIDENGNPKINSEHMSKKFVKEVICKWIDDAELGYL